MIALFLSVGLRRTGYTLTTYYNAGSAILVLVLIAMLVRGFLRRRSRKHRPRGLSLSTHQEAISLNSSIGDGEGELKGNGFRSRKGKEKASSAPEEEAIFDVGSDDEDERRS